MIRRLLIFVAAWTVLALPGFAVDPSEVLADPVLEARARSLSTGLRCLVCRNQSIDESNAELARDLRVLLRERLVAGDTDDQAIDYLVDRYGNYILLKPPLTASTLLLWIGPLILFLGAVLGFWRVWVRSARRPDIDETDTLSEEDRAILAAALSTEGET